MNHPELEERLLELRKQGRPGDLQQYLATQRQKRMARMVEQAPSVGRVVHYVAYGTPGGEFPAGVCRCALITETYQKGNMPPSGTVMQIDGQGQCTTVGLVVLNPTGQFFNRGIPYDPDKGPGTWHWPERV